LWGGVRTVSLGTHQLELTVLDAWAIQQSIKHDMVVRLWSGQEEPAGQSLRQKVNGLIVQFVDESAGPESSAAINVTEEELWLIDKQLPLSYAGARELLVRVFRGLLALAADGIWGDRGQEVS
jgi:hypothetical protein